MYVNNPIISHNDLGIIGLQQPQSLIGNPVIIHNILAVLGLREPPLFIGNPVQPGTTILDNNRLLNEQKPQLPSIHEFVSSGLIAQIIPIEIINNALKEHSKESQRIRLLPSPTIVYFIMAMNIWRDDSQEEVLKNICQGLKNIDPSFTFDTFPTRAAISKARIKLGASVMESIANQVFDTIAIPDTIGAWYHSKRLMALDGTCFKVPDEKDNATYFGYPHSTKGKAGYPEARAVGLVELGTRAFVKVAIGPYSDSEIKLTHQLVQEYELTPEMILLADRNFYSYQLWNKCAERDTSLLWRVKRSLRLPVLETFSDGSYLSEVKDSKDKSQPAVKVRVIDYDLNVKKDSSSDKDKQEKYILLTNLFDFETYPAKELAALYHERWGIETTFNELKSTLNSNSVLRSKTPDLVNQEIWGLFITHFAIRQLMAQAALEKNKDPDELSFTDSIGIIKRDLPLAAAFPPEQLKVWRDSLINEIANTKCQSSKGKSNPRGCKCTVKHFPVRRRGEKLNQKQDYTITINIRKK
jgi:hypothetical protein